MKLKHWLRYILIHDTTWHGQFTTLQSLLLGQRAVERVVIDVGANDGFYSSNSYPFIKRGWRAILIEPHPGAFAKARQLHANNPRVTLLNLACSDHPGEMVLNLFAADEGGSQSVLSSDEPHPPADRTVARTITVQVATLETLLEQQGVSKEFGLLSVDTEGHDYRVIRGLNLSRFRPRVIITENYVNDELKSAYLREQGYQVYRKLECDTVWTVLKF
ncbi:MAG: FkbM family methyltransferase [Verrucomicrobiota bacterium]|jgi:FkbM family methyltransferase